VSYATTKWVSQKLKGEALKRLNGDQHRVPAWLATQNGVKAIKASDASTLNDQSGELQGIIDRMVDAALGNKLWIPAGTYVVNDGFQIPENHAVVVEGDGPGWRSAAGKGSYLLRTDDPSAESLAATGGAMIACLGSDSGDTKRALGGVRHLQLDGGASAGVTEGIGLEVQRGQEFDLEHVRFYNFPSHALRANQVFNATWDKLRITHSGDAAADEAALHIGGAGAPGNIDGTITLDILGLQQEQNNGTDLKVTGNPTGTGHPSTEINIIGGKWEGGDSHTNPYHHWEFAELVNVVGIGIFSHRSGTPILSEHLLTGAGEDRGVTYTGCWFEIGSSVTPPDYFIEVLGGAVHFVNCTFKMDLASAFAHVGPLARPGCISFTGCRFFDLSGGVSTVPLLDDER